MLETAAEIVPSGGVKKATVRAVWRSWGTGSAPGILGTKNKTHGQHSRRTTTPMSSERKLGEQANVQKVPMSLWRDSKTNI